MSAGTPADPAPTVSAGTPADPSAPASGVEQRPGHLGDPDAAACQPVDPQARAVLERELATPRTEARQGAPGGLVFGPLDLVFGPGDGGRLAALSAQAGGRRVSALARSEVFPNRMAKSRLVLDWARRNGALVHFDLTRLAASPGEGTGAGHDGESINDFELGYVRDRWNDRFSPFRDVVRFYRDGRAVPEPWEAPSTTTPEGARGAGALSTSTSVAGDGSTNKRRS